MSPWNMKNSVKKLEYYGNDQIILTDRGTFFGYNMLVNDMRSLPIMKKQAIQFVLTLHILFNNQLLWVIFQVDRENSFLI